MAERAQARLPDFVVIGAPRAGTTSIWAYLDAHPAVFMARPKELHFFDLEYERGLDWYAGQFAAAPPGRLAGEATPDYLAHPTAMARLTAALPDTRLIAILRHPVERAYSHFLLWRNAHFLAPMPFAEAVEAELADDAPTPGFLDGSRYIRHIERTLTGFPRERLLVMLTDDLRDNPAGAYTSLTGFIAIEARPPLRRDRIQENSIYRYRSRRLRRAMLGQRAWHRAPALAARLEAWNRRPVRPEPLDPAVRRRLLDFYAKDNDALATFLGRDLSAWSR